MMNKYMAVTGDDVDGDDWCGLGGDGDGGDDDDGGGGDSDDGEGNDGDDWVVLHEIFACWH